MYISIRAIHVAHACRYSPAVCITKYIHVKGGRKSRGKQQLNNTTRSVQSCCDGPPWKRKLDDTVDPSDEGSHLGGSCNLTKGRPYISNHQLLPLRWPLSEGVDCKCYMYPSGERPKLGAFGSKLWAGFRSPFASTHLFNLCFRVESFDLRAKTFLPRNDPYPAGSYSKCSRPQPAYLPKPR